MNIKLLVALLTRVVVVSCQSTISSSNLVQCDDLKSELESIRQSLKIQQQKSEEIISQIQEIRKVMIQQQNQPRRGLPSNSYLLPLHHLK